MNILYTRNVCRNQAWPTEHNRDNQEEENENKPLLTSDRAKSDMSYSFNLVLYYNTILKLYDSM